MMLVARNVDLGRIGGARSRCTTWPGSPRSCWAGSAGDAQEEDAFIDQFGGQTFTWHAATASAAALTPGQPATPPATTPYQGGSADY
jgi:hypothetical protein